MRQSLRLLSAAFRQELTEATVEAYAIGLEGLTGEQIVRATKWLLRHHSEFMPTPAQLRQAVQDSYIEAPVRYLPESDPMTEDQRVEVQKMIQETAEKLGFR